MIRAPHVLTVVLSAQLFLAPTTALAGDSNAESMAFRGLEQRLKTNTKRRSKIGVVPRALEIQDKGASPLDGVKSETPDDIIRREAVEAADDSASVFEERDEDSSPSSRSTPSVATDDVADKRGVDTNPKDITPGIPMSISDVEKALGAISIGGKSNKLLGNVNEKSAGLNGFIYRECRKKVYIKQIDSVELNKERVAGWQILEAKKGDLQACQEDQSKKHGGLCDNGKGESVCYALSKLERLDLTSDKDLVKVGLLTRPSLDDGSDYAFDPLHNRDSKELVFEGSNAVAERERLRKQKERETFISDTKKSIDRCLRAEQFGDAERLLASLRGVADFTEEKFEEERKRIGRRWLEKIKKDAENFEIADLDSVKEDLEDWVANYGHFKGFTDKAYNEAGKLMADRTVNDNENLNLRSYKEASSYFKEMRGWDGLSRDARGEIRNYSRDLRVGQCRFMGGYGLSGNMEFNNCYGKLMYDLQNEAQSACFGNSMGFGSYPGGMMNGSMSMFGNSRCSSVTNTLNLAQQLPQAAAQAEMQRMQMNMQMQNMQMSIQQALAGGGQNNGMQNPFAGANNGMQNGGINSMGVMGMGGMNSIGNPLLGGGPLNPMQNPMGSFNTGAAGIRFQ